MSGRPTATILLLACAFAWHGAEARDVALQGPNGDGGTCIASRAGSAGEPEVGNAQDAAPAATATAKPPTTRAVGGGGGGVTRTTQAPRWHSFLPGMFR